MENLDIEHSDLKEPLLPKDTYGGYIKKRRKSNKRRKTRKRTKRKRTKKRKSRKRTNKKRRTIVGNVNCILFI